MTAFAWLLLAAAALHPQSQSTSRVVVRGPQVELQLRCQQAALIEAVGHDADGDGALDEVELAAAEGAVEAYVRGRYRLLPVQATQAAPVELVRLDLLEARAIPSPGPLSAEGWVELRLAGAAQQPLAAFRAEVRLFRERNPLHRDTASVQFNGEPVRVFFTGPDVDAWVFEPAQRRRPRVLWGFLRQGLAHILGGWDHLAFLLALLLAARGLASLAATVTAFTLAHSLSLALAVLDVVYVPARPVELAIALSIAYVALENLLAPRSSARWVEAFVFGLVHGLGFAGFLGESLLAEPLRLTALVGFNLGVELGQLAVVVPLALLLRALPGRRALEGDVPPPRLAPTWARAGGSAVVAALGLMWFAGRAGWL